MKKVNTKIQIGHEKTHFFVGGKGEGNWERERGVRETGQEREGEGEREGRETWRKKGGRLGERREGDSKEREGRET